MSQLGPKAMFQRGILRTPGEWVWGGLGMAAAAVSASFALYMVVFGPAGTGVGSVSEFRFLATMKPRAETVESHATPLLRGGTNHDRPADVEAASNLMGPNPVDFAPTGSVEEGAASGPKPPRPAKVTRPPAEIPLASFSLREVFDGQALVDSPGGVALVAPGSVLAGAGKVLAIERRGGGWVVTTSGGVIGAAAR